MIHNDSPKKLVKARGRQIKREEITKNIGKSSIKNKKRELQKNIGTSSGCAVRKGKNKRDLSEKFTKLKNRH